MRRGADAVCWLSTRLLVPHSILVASAFPPAHLNPAPLHPPCSVVVEGKNANAAFVPFRLVNYLCPAPASLAAAVAEVAELICQEEKYEAGECNAGVSVCVSRARGPVCVGK